MSVIPNLDLANVAAATGFTFPVGVYQLRIVDAEVKPTKTAGEPMMHIKCEIVGTPAGAENMLGKNAFQRFLLVKDKGFGLSMFRSLIEAVGLPLNVDNTDLLLGRVFASKTYVKNGQSEWDRAVAVPTGPAAPNMAPQPPQQYAPAPQQYAPAPQQYAQAPQSQLLQQVGYAQPAPQQVQTQTPMYAAPPPPPTTVPGAR